MNDRFELLSESYLQQPDGCRICGGSTSTGSKQFMCLDCVLACNFTQNHEHTHSADLLCGILALDTAVRRYRNALRTHGFAYSILSPAGQVLLEDLALKNRQLTEWLQPDSEQDRVTETARQLVREATILSARYTTRPATTEVNHSLPLTCCPA